eukprot:CAMPEP_0201522576 /NCGR_PEP_ID=MMETSP0161_2-20130828/18220_1 /ASSEMBLY_ACC=CAM_ASM_000251 /TAXON_ID=180227 /ORGANISM="Neoparamoeba aestuarina, Strain SoJaBio B1-5/56/2" /LENGTH=159 /DNA_ID=CAMNT_0047921473 /DNA_START=421 /DNA_END=897 /DNA_ORIENTATION=+
MTHQLSDLEEQVSTISSAIAHLENIREREEEEKRELKRQMEENEWAEKRAIAAGKCVEEAVERILEHGTEPRKLLYFSREFVSQLLKKTTKKMVTVSVRSLSSLRIDETNTYGLEKLQNEDFVRQKGLNERELERYLPEDEFEAVLGENYGKLPRWKQW